MLRLNKSAKVISLRICTSNSSFGRVVPSSASKTNAYLSLSAKNDDSRTVQLFGSLTRQQSGPCRKIEGEHVSAVVIRVSYIPRM